jgi:hypothetical protein
MPAQSKVISEKGVLSNQSDFEGWFWIVKRLANANEIWKYINPDDSERVDLEEPAAEPAASSSAAATVWKEKKKDYRSAKEGMAKLEKHITETLDAKLHGLLTPCATVAEQVKVLYDHFNQSITQQYLDAVQEYTTARKYSTRSQSVEDWCSDFQMAYNKAVRYRIPDVMDFRAQHEPVEGLSQCQSRKCCYCSLNCPLQGSRVPETCNGSPCCCYFNSFCRYAKDPH